MGTVFLVQQPPQFIAVNAGANTGYQQPVMGGYQQPVMGGYQQPVMGGYQQPMGIGFQQPVMGGYQLCLNNGYQQDGAMEFALGQMVGDAITGGNNHGCHRQNHRQSHHQSHRNYGNYGRNERPSFGSELAKVGILGKMGTSIARLFKPDSEKLCKTEKIFGITGEAGTGLMGINLLEGLTGGGTGGGIGDLLGGLLR